MFEIICSLCNRTFKASETKWRCDCGGLLDILFTPEFPLKKIRRRKPTMWRYREAIPILDDDNIVSFDEGFTPLLQITIDDRPVWIKQDHLFPSGSFKDRGASVMISHIRTLGLHHIVEDSSGNAGASVAAYAAQGGLACSIYAPDSASPGKINQIRNYGADLHLISGSRDDVANAAIQFAETSCYYASHAWNPFFFHGTKTFAYEVCEQLKWKAPDTVILPVGNGTILLGAHLGFKELRQAGIIEQVPRLIAIQADICAPIAHAFLNLDSVRHPLTTPLTIAEGIRVAAPIREHQILNALKETNGAVITVSEDEIRYWMCRSALMGFCIEPTSAATIAGVHRCLQSTPDPGLIVTSFTGHGLKSAFSCSQ